MHIFSTDFSQIRSCSWLNAANILHYPKSSPNTTTKKNSHSLQKLNLLFKFYTSHTTCSVKLCKPSLIRFSQASAFFTSMVLFSKYLKSISPRQLEIRKTLFFSFWIAILFKGRFLNEFCKWYCLAENANASKKQKTKKIRNIWLMSFEIPAS